MIKENLDNIWKKIESVCNKSGRNLNEITLVGVTKTFSSNVIMEAVEHKLFDLGESKVQELISKKDDIPDIVRWHFIGHLQKNKVKHIADFIHLIHSVDSFELAKEIDKHANKNRRQIPILVQINISNEETKFGVESENVYKLVKEISQLENIKVQGLMTIGTYYEDIELSRTNFRKLKNIFDELKLSTLNNAEMKHLSMGMSHDFTVAIEEGATMIRVGTALFGERYYA
jgi:pyridoxal phosphate enzyme (YggS family)